MNTNKDTLHLYVNIPDSSPCFDTVAAALESIQASEEQAAERTYPAPASPVAPAVIHIGQGVYREKLVITRPNLTLLGEGKAREDVVLVWGDAALDLMPEGDKRGTFRTSSVRIDTSDFTARHLTFQNDAGYGHAVGQALALYAEGDRLYFEDCCLLGSQDTLFTAPLPPTEAIPGGFKGPGENRPRIMGRHCYRNCLIQGDIDFIFGSAVAWFENCVLFSKLPAPLKASPFSLPAQKNTSGGVKTPDVSSPGSVCGYVTAASTPKDQPFGYVFKNCRLESDCPPGTVMLGRPWREWAKTVYLDCHLGAHIHPQGWADWDKPHGHFYYGEYRSTGPGADPTARASFSHQLTDREAEAYTTENVLAGWKPGT